MLSKEISGVGNAEVPSFGYPIANMSVVREIPSYVD
jgi:hypothetical protein